jgi:hypothetical protein
MKIKVFSVILYILVLSQVCSAKLCAKLVEIAAGEALTFGDSE